MKAVLALLSVLCFLVAPVLLVLSLAQLNPDYDTESTSDCTTVPPASEGLGATEQCTAADAAGGQQVFTVWGAAFLVSGAVLAAASVTVRHPDERRAPAPWHGGPPQR